jgi:hypothetical protein
VDQEYIDDDEIFLEFIIGRIMKDCIKIMISVDL